MLKLTPFIGQQEHSSNMPYQKPSQTLIEVHGYGFTTTLGFEIVALLYVKMVSNWNPEKFII